MKYKVYHGRTVKDSTFDYKYVGNVNEPTSDQYGPGFYFTDDKNEAIRYSDVGGIVIHAMIEINNPLSDKKKLTKKEVEFMIRNAPEVARVFDNMKDKSAMEEAFYETVTLSNIDPDFTKAYRTAVSWHIGKPALNNMMYIWREHYRYDPDSYLKNLLALGYDGVIVPSQADLFVVFSPEQIQTINVEEVTREEPINESIIRFIRSLKRDSNDHLIEAIVDGYHSIYENGRVGGKSLTEYNRYKYLNNVTIYRARSVDSDYFMSDDYVTLSPQFAIDHAESTHVYTDEPQIVIRAKVPPKYVVDASNPGEYFYKGDDIKGDVAYISKGDEYEGIISDISKTKLQFPIDMSLVESSNIESNITSLLSFVESLKPQVNNTLYNILIEAIDVITESEPFDINTFKKLHSFASRVKYTKSKLPQLGTGSSRTTFDLGDEKVLKLAKNAKGIAQNGVEADGYVQQSGIVAKVYDSDPDDLWIIADNVQNITQKEFGSLLGIPFKVYCQAILTHESEVRGNSRSVRYLNSDQMSEFWENEFMYGIFDLMGSMNLMGGDLTRIGSYGKCRGELLLRDAGYTEHIMKEHYSPKKR